MIEYIKGSLTELTPAQAVIEAAGVGYALNISLNTFSAIQSKQEVKLFVFEVIREDTHLLYGFSSKKEREMFTLLITVQGVGVNTARMILSAMSVAELCNCISTGNERMIKIVALGIVDDIPAGGAISSPVNNEVRDEAVSALSMLGFAPAPSQKVVVEYLQQHPDAPVEVVVKEALNLIK